MKSSSSNSILRQDCICLSRCHPLLPSSYYFYITYADLLISYLVSTPVDPFIPFSIHSPSFHSIRLKSFACKSRCRQISRNASIPVNWSRSGAITCTFHPTLSLSLSSSPRFLIPQTRVASQPRKRALESLKQRGAPLSFPWHPRFRPRPRPNRVYLPNFPPTRPSTPLSQLTRHRMNFETGYPSPPAVETGQQGISTREHRLNLPRFWPLKKLRHFISPRLELNIPLPLFLFPAKIDVHVRNPFRHPRSTQPSFNTSATGAEGSGGKVNLQRVDATRDFSRIEAGREGISRVAGDRSYSVTHNLHVRNMKPAASSTKWSGQRGPPLEGSGRSLSRWPSLSLCKITCGRAIRVPCFIGSRLSSRSSLFPARSTIFRRVLREKRREKGEGEKWRRKDGRKKRDKGDG